MKRNEEKRDKKEGGRERNREFNRSAKMVRVMYVFEHY